MRLPLSDDQKTLISRLSAKLTRQQRCDARFDAYYEAEQKLEHIGLAIPPELQRFGTVINIPAMAVDEPERRQDLKEFQRVGTGPAATTADPALTEGWLYNNLKSQSALCHKDTKIYGRSLVSVHTNDEDPEFPRITVEDPTQIAYLVDNRRRRMVAAFRRYRDELERTDFGTLYLPDVTLWLSRGPAGWQVDDADDHRLGAVALILHLNRPRTARWDGVTEMRDVMGMTDFMARLLTNMAIGAETHSLPDKWAAGVSKGDFVDAATGKPLPTWDAYLTKIKATSNPAAKFGQFQASDLRNFHESVNNMLAWCAAVLGLPTRYAGQQSVNPASEGAIRADESRLIKNVERMNDHAGDCWAWTGSLYERFRTGQWPDKNSIRVLWNDPATPTRAQQADATVKLHQEKIVSTQGAWDELGWSPERKARELEYFRQEQQDPYLTLLAREPEPQNA